MQKEKHTDKLLQRLETFVNKKGDTLGGLTKAIGLSYSYFSKLKTTNGSIGSDVLVRVVNHYKDLSFDWLLTGQSTMFKGKISNKEIQRYEAMEQKFLETQKNIIFD